MAALTTVAEWASTALLSLGAMFIVIATLGILRMPDLFMRMQAATKASALGVSLMMAGAAFHFLRIEVTLRAVAVILLIFVTIPVGAHLLARTAYLTGIGIWEGTRIVGREEAITVDEDQGPHPDGESTPTNGMGAATADDHGDGPQRS